MQRSEAGFGEAARVAFRDMVREYQPTSISGKETALRSVMDEIDLAQNKYGDVAVQEVFGQVEEYLIRFYVDGNEVAQLKLGTGGMF